MKEMHLNGLRVRALRPWLFAGVAILVVALIHHTTADRFSRDVERIYRITLATQRSLAPGGASNFLSHAALLKGGVGHCGHYSQLLRENAEQAGFVAKVIGVIGKNGQTHVLNEVLVDGKWIVADGLDGVVYPHSFHEMLKNPTLARDMIGTPPKQFRIITGPGFFDGALIITPGERMLADEVRALPNDGLSLTTTLLTIRRAEKHIDYPNRAAQFLLTGPETIVVKPSSPDIFDAVQISTLAPLTVILSDGTRVEVNGSSTDPFVASPFITIPILHYRAADGNVTLRLEPSGKEPMQVAITPLVAVAEIEKVLLLTPSQPSTFVFRGDNVVDVDKVAFNCDGQSIWSSDVGAPDDLDDGKNKPSFFAGRSGNPWSGRKEDAGHTFRTTIPGLPSTEPRILLLPYKTTRTSCMIYLTYRNRGSKPTPFLIAFPDSSEQQLAELRPVHDFTLLAIHVGEETLKKLGVRQ